LVHLLIGSSVDLSVAFASFGSLFLLSPDFLRVLVVLDDIIDFTDYVLFVGQEISVFVNRCVPRVNVRPIDVGNIWEGDEALAVGSVNLFYRPIPLKLGLASFGTFNNIGGLLRIRVHVRPGITHECCRSWLVGVGENGRIGDAAREVCGEQDKGETSTVRSSTNVHPEVEHRSERVEHG
jgi:hypothetical protein